MPFFGKKKKEEAAEGAEEGEAQEPSFDNVPVAKSEAPTTQATSSDRLGLDVEKLKAQFNSFYELQKAAGERFARINEQIGELRAMMIDMDRAKQKLEAKATQAIDIVESVHPDKIMIELRKQDAKVEAVRASLDSHEAMINNVLTELKEMRNKLAMLRGLDETLKLSESVKADLMEIKKTQALTQRHSDRVETIFAEMTKNFSDMNRFRDITNDLNNSMKKLISDVDSLSVKLDSMATKKETDELSAKFAVFEKRTSGLVELMSTRIEASGKKADREIDEKMKEVSKLIAGFKNLAQKVPDLDKYFGLIEAEAKKIPDEVKVEKIKEAGQEEKMEEPEEKKGFRLGKIFKRGGQ